MNKVIGITCSTFDLFHPGHIKMLEEAKLHCDYLIAALQTDPTTDRPAKNKPIQSVVERYIQLDSCKLIDKIVPYETEEDLNTIFSLYNINVRIIGEEYRDKEFTAKKTCEDRGIKIIFNTRDHGFSSTELRNRIYDKEKTLRYKVTKDKIPS